MVEQARAQTEEMTREHAAEIRGMVIEWQSNRERLSRHDNSLIPLASERTRAALAAYRGGAGTLTTVLEARRGEIDRSRQFAIFDHLCTALRQSQRVADLITAERHVGRNRGI